MDERILAVNGAIAKLNEVISTYAPEGSEVLFITDKNANNIELIKRILSRKYRVIQPLDSITLDADGARKIKVSEQTRVVISAGGGSSVDVGKFVSTRYHLPLVAVALNPSCLGYFLPSSMLSGDGAMTEIYKTVSPKIVICDGELLDNDERFLCASVGDICARLTALFDASVTAFLHEEDAICDNVKTQLLQCVAKTLLMLNRPALDPLEVAEQSLKTSLILSQTASSRLYLGGEFQLAEGLRLIRRKNGLESKLWGETALISASIAMRVYIAFLSLSLVHPHAVPDNNYRIDLMKKTFGVGAITASAKVTPIVTKCECDKMAYCLRDGKTELLKTAFAYEKALNFALTRFKRLYKDRGYSYNNYMTKAHLRDCVRLAPETGGKTTLFTVMKRFGLIG